MAMIDAAPHDATRQHKTSRKDNYKNAKAVNRSRIVKIGKKLRKYFNPFIKSQSLISTDPVLPRGDLPWLSVLEDNWQVIAAEAEEILRHREAIPPLTELSPDHKGLDSRNRWRSFFLKAYGFKSDDNCSRCPQTMAILRRIPGVRTAMFSIHEPGMVIPPHKGVTASIVVAHLGLKIPQQPWAAQETCAIRVADDVVAWETGKAFAFDDTVKHETWNHTDQERVILLLHVDRPLRWRGRLAAALFMSGIRWSPFIGDARAKLGDWEKKFRAHERQTRPSPTKFDPASLKRSRFDAAE